MLDLVPGAGLPSLALYGPDYHPRLGLISSIERMPCALYGAQGCHPGPYIKHMTYVLGNICGIRCHPGPYIEKDDNSGLYIGQYARPWPYVLHRISILGLRLL